MNFHNLKQSPKGYIASAFMCILRIIFKKILKNGIRTIAPEQNWPRLGLGFGLGLVLGLGAIFLEPYKTPPDECYCVISNTSS